MPALGAVDRIRVGVDELVELDPAELSDAALAEELLALRREIDRQDAVLARLAHAGHVRGVGLADGAASTASWLRHRAGMREGDARAVIECGEVCDLLAETGAAWRAGEISTGMARTIVGARVAGHDDALAECEPVLLDLARRGDLWALGRAAGHFRSLARAEGSDPGEHDGLHLSQTFAGRWLLNGELEGVGAETVCTAIHAYTEAPSDGDDRTPAQRRAAALVRICEVALAHAGEVDGVERPRANVSMVFDWRTVTEAALGRSDGEFTGSVHPADAYRVLCDCNLSRVITGPDSLPLDVGRARRTVPPALRRALVVRDGGCRFPGCNRPSGWTDAHHVQHWVNGGRTCLDNLVLLCDRHHAVVHQRGWLVKFDGHELRVIRPDGTELTSCRTTRNESVRPVP